MTDFTYPFRWDRRGESKFQNLVANVENALGVDLSGATQEFREVSELNSAISRGMSTGKGIDAKAAGDALIAETDPDAIMKRLTELANAQAREDALVRAYQAGGFEYKMKHRAELAANDGYNAMIEALRAPVGKLGAELVKLFDVTGGADLADPAVVLERDAVKEHKAFLALRSKLDTVGTLSKGRGHAFLFAPPVESEDESEENNTWRHLRPDFEGDRYIAAVRAGHVVELPADQTDFDKRLLRADSALARMAPIQGITRGATYER